MHAHKCECGKIWCHGEQDRCRAENTKAHTCPACGKEQYQKYFSPRNHRAKTLRERATACFRKALGYMI